MFREEVIEIGRRELLHAEFDLALFRIDSQHLCLNYFARPQYIARMRNPPFSRDFADVNKPLNAFGQLHKCAECCEPSDRAFDASPNRKPLSGIGPRIAQRLLQAERQLAFRLMDSEHHSFYGVTLLYDVPWLLDPPGP